MYNQLRKGGKKVLTFFTAAIMPSTKLMESFLFPRQRCQQNLVTCRRFITWQI